MHADLLWRAGAPLLAASLLSGSSLQAQEEIWPYDHLDQCPRVKPGDERPDGCTRQRRAVVSPGEQVIRQEADTTFGTDGSVVNIETSNRVREDEERKDAATVGFATLATVNLPRILKARDWSWLNLVVGIGLETGGETQYYFGGGAELHSGIFLNLGYTLGRVNTLPSGLSIGDAVTDANALNNLGRRSASGVFVGLSSTFLGGGQAVFGKPLAGTAEARGT